MKKKRNFVMFYVMLHGNEYWTMKNNEQSKLEASDISKIRSIIQKKIFAKNWSQLILVEKTAKKIKQLLD